jgi:hypothetical protein
LPTELLLLLQSNIESLTQKFDTFEAAVTNKLETIERGYSELEGLMK